MEIIAAGKKLSLILIYRAINWFIAYRDRPIRPAGGQDNRDPDLQQDVQNAVVHVNVWARLG